MNISRIWRLYSPTDTPPSQLCDPYKAVQLSLSLIGQLSGPQLASGGGGGASLVPTLICIWLKRVECGSAESNMLHMRQIFTFLFLCFSKLECATGEAYCDSAELHSTLLSEMWVNVGSEHTAWLAYRSYFSTSVRDSSIIRCTSAHFTS
jgi:hypothetical protein